MGLTFDDVAAARERIAAHLSPTPLLESFYLGGPLATDGARAKRHYYLKLEGLQPTRAFKIRGALSAMCDLGERERERGVGCISSGNHGIAVAYAARLLGLPPATVIVPQDIPDAKASKIELFGGRVVRMGKGYDGAHELGVAYLAQHGLTEIDSCNWDPRVYAGQGTCALEILEQCPHIDTILCPIGGGGLVSGVAVAAKHINPAIRVIGVQTSACPAMLDSVADGHPHYFQESAPSLCDALVGGIGQLSWEIVPKLVDDLIAVDEKSIARAVAFLACQEKIVAEPASATTVAAVMDHTERVGGHNVALVLSGSNIDDQLLARLCCGYSE